LGSNSQAAFILGDASALGFLPSHHVARDVQENQRGKNNNDVDDVAVAKHGAPVVAQREAEVLAAVRQAN
jgi:hypothetical protein